MRRVIYLLISISLLLCVLQMFEVSGYKETNMKDPDKYRLLSEGTYCEKLGSFTDPDSYPYIYYYIYVPPFMDLEIQAEITEIMYQHSEPLDSWLQIALTDNLWGTEGDSDKRDCMSPWQFESIYEDEDGKIDGGYTNNQMISEEVTILVSGQCEFMMNIDLNPTNTGWIGLGSLAIFNLILISTVLFVTIRKKQ